MIEVHFDKVENVVDKSSEIFKEVFGHLNVDNVFPSDLCFWTADEDGEWRAFIIIRCAGAACHVLWGGSRPKYRGDGISAYLQAFKQLRKMGYTEVTTLVKQDNTKMLMTALRIGYKITGMTTGKDGKLEIIFHKRLEE